MPRKDTTSRGWRSAIRYGGFSKSRESGDVSLGRQLINDMERQTFLLKRCDWSKQVIDWARENFGGIVWTNTRAGENRR